MFSTMFVSGSHAGHPRVPPSRHHDNALLEDTCPALCVIVCCDLNSGKIKQRSSDGRHPRRRRDGWRLWNCGQDGTLHLPEAQQVRLKCSMTLAKFLM